MGLLGENPEMVEDQNFDQVSRVRQDTLFGMIQV